MENEMIDEQIELVLNRLYEIALDDILQRRQEDRIDARYEQLDQLARSEANEEETTG